MGKILHRLQFMGLAGNVGRFIVSNGRDLVFAPCQCQPDRGADLSKSDNSNFDSHRFLIFTILLTLIICRLQGSQKGFFLRMRIMVVADQFHGARDWRLPGRPAVRPTRHAVPPPRKAGAIRQEAPPPSPVRHFWKKRFPITISDAVEHGQGIQDFSNVVQQGSRQQVRGGLPAVFQSLEQMVCMQLFGRLHAAEEDELYRSEVGKQALACDAFAGS